MIDPNDIEGWQFVFWGDQDNWPAIVEMALGRIDPSDERAHHILSREVDGPRWSLLLVHYSVEEREAVYQTMSDKWEYSFVNAVIDITENQ